MMLRLVPEEQCEGCIGEGMLTCLQDAMERKLSENAQNPCTVPTQPKTGILSAIKTIGYESFITPLRDDKVFGVLGEERPRQEQLQKHRQ